MWNLREAAIRVAARFVRATLADELEQRIQALLVRPSTQQDWAALAKWMRDDIPFQIGRRDLQYYLTDVRTFVEVVGKAPMATQDRVDAAKVELRRRWEAVRSQFESTTLESKNEPDVKPKRKRIDKAVMVRDEGRFVLHYLPQHAAAVDPIAALVHRAFRNYDKAGIKIRHKLVVALDGRKGGHHKASYWPTSNPPLIRIAPKSYKDVTLHDTIVHELGHYVHEHLVAGGHGNSEVRTRYRWAIRQTPSGEGPQTDVLYKRIEAIQAEMKRLQDLRLVQRELPRRGQLFEFDDQSSQPVHWTVRILGKSRDRVKYEVVDYAPKNTERTKHLVLYRKSPNGLPMIEEPIKNLTSTSDKDPAVESKLKSLKAERDKLWETFKEYADTEKDDRYMSLQHAWVPTKYSRENDHEWFAELCTTYVLGHLQAEPAAWLKGVIN